MANYLRVINIQISRVYCNRNSIFGIEQARFQVGHVTVDHVLTFHCINDNDDRFYIALFSALQQTHCAFVRDGKGVSVAFFIMH